jgi:hypothetical protein
VAVNLSEIHAIGAAFVRASAAAARMAEQYASGRNLLSHVADWFEDRISEELRAAAEAAAAAVASLQRRRDALIEDPSAGHEEAILFVADCDRVEAAAEANEATYAQAKHWLEDKAGAAADAAGDAVGNAGGALKWIGEHATTIAVVVGLVVLAPIIAAAASWLPRRRSS